MDLSLNLPAFCVAEVHNGEFKVIELAHVDNKRGKGVSKLTTATKLHRTGEKLRELHDKYGNFDVVVREKGFSRYSNTTQLLFRVVGMIDFLVYDLLGVDTIEEYPPTSIKTIIAGYSKADKVEVEEGVRKLLHESQKDIEFYSDDESDAVAVALTYCIKTGLLN